MLGAGERAALVAEQLRLEQLLGQRRAIQRHERPALAGGRGMDEPRHDFLAGPRLAGHQHGGVRRGHLRRLAQHPAPFDRLADHPRVAAVAELVRETSHARVELPGPGAAVLGLARRGRQLFVGHGDSDVVDDAASQRQMAALVRVKVLRPESDAEHPIAGPRGGREQRPVPARREPRRSAHAANHRKVFGRQVADDAVLRERRLQRMRAHVMQVGGCRLDDELTVPADEANSQRVVRQDPVGDLRQAGEDGAHVEHFSDGPQKIRRSSDIRVDGSRCVRGRLSNDGHTHLRFTASLSTAPIARATPIEACGSTGLAGSATRSSQGRSTGRAGWSPERGGMKPRSGGE